MRRETQGTTLAELLITMSVFAFLMVSMFTIMKLGSGGLRDIQGKGDVQRALRRFEADIIQEVKRSSLASIGIYTPSTDYRWAIWMKTAMNDHDATKDNPVMILNDPVQMITSSAGSFTAQRYVLYYLAKMNRDDHNATYGDTCEASYSATGGPDTICPHKWIIKKDIYLTKDRTSAGTDTIGTQGATAFANLADATLNLLSDQETQAQLGAEPTLPGSVEARVQVMAQNIVSFELARLSSAGSATTAPVASATGQIVLFDVKTFKVLDAQKNITFGSSAMVTVPMSNTANAGVQVSDVETAATTGVSTLQTGSTIQPAFQPYTVQLDARVVPENP